MNSHPGRIALGCPIKVKSDIKDSRIIVDSSWQINRENGEMLTKRCKVSDNMNRFGRSMIQRGTHNNLLYT